MGADQKRGLAGLVDFDMAVFNSVINPTWSAFLLLGLTSLLPKQCGGAFGIGDIYDSPRSDGNDSPFSPPQPTATFVDHESGNVTYEVCSWDNSELCPRKRWRCLACWLCNRWWPRLLSL